MILGDSLWSNTSNGTLELVPRRILELVGDFRRAKNPGFGLGRTGLTPTGLTGVVVKLNGTGLTGMGYRSDR